jgi:lipoyl-dependent peroxiredoxin
MKPTKIHYTARATSTGGRKGHTESDDHIVSHIVAVPVEMGGAGGATNPEQLFAAGYAACFGSAIELVARHNKTPIGMVTVTAEIGIGPAGPGFALAATLTAKIADVDRAIADDLVARAHEVCPYSNATRGNIDVVVRVAQ